jgi:hypothetical protein
VKQTAAALAAAAAPTPGTVWAILGCIAAAGAVGGLVNALTGGSGGTGRLIMPQVVQPQGVFQLGFIGNIVLGAFGAVLTWGLYGPLKDSVMIGTRPAGGLPANLTVTALVGAALTGAAGAKVITSELDKYVLKKTAVTAAAGAGDPNLAVQIASSHPIAALAAAMPRAPAATAAGGADSPPATAAAPAAAPQSVP